MGLSHVLIGASGLGTAVALWDALGMSAADESCAGEAHAALMVEELARRISR